MDKPLNDMTISDVIVHPFFQQLLINELGNIVKEIRMARGAHELKKTPLINLYDRGDLKHGRFSFLYAQCLDKVSDLPSAERKIIIEIGNNVFHNAMIQLQEDEAKGNNADGTDK